MGGILWLIVGLGAGLIVGWVLRGRGGAGRDEEADAARLETDRREAALAAAKGELDRHRARIDELEKRVHAVRAEATAAADEKNLRTISGLQGEVDDHQAQARASAERYAAQVGNLERELAEHRREHAAAATTAAPEPAVAEPIAEPAKDAPEIEARREADGGEADGDGEADADIHTIEGVGPVFTARLRAVGVAHVATLLERGATSAGRSALATQTGIDEKRLLTWVNHVDLMRVAGIDQQLAELLEAAGIDSPAELGRRNATNLATRLADVNRRRRIAPAVPDADAVGAWIASARGVAPIVRH